MTESRAQNVREKNGERKIEEGIVGPPNRRAAKRELESKVFTKKENRSRTWTWIRRTRWPARSVGGRTGIQEQQVLEAEQLVRVKAQLAVALVQQLREARVLAAELQRAARATHRVDHVVGLHGQRSSSGSTQSKYELFTIFTVNSVRNTVGGGGGGGVQSLRIWERRGANATGMGEWEGVRVPLQKLFA